MSFGLLFCIAIPGQHDRLSSLKIKLPTLTLAPMQDVTTLAFWHALEPCGGADLYVTEYFRVHASSRLEPFILDSITQNPTGKPVIAQMIGKDIDLLEKATRELHNYPIAGIDMNLGCPAPIVCGKDCGGALLKDPERIRGIVERLRPIVPGMLTLKTRVGYDSADEFDALLELFGSLPIDGLAIHGRTVKEKYQSLVHTDKIAQAASCLPFPVTANGSVISVPSALGMLEKTQASGLMIGRGAIRNPWLFSQVRQALAGEPVYVPTKADLHAYVCRLIEAVGKTMPKYNENSLAQRMKRFMNYVAVGINDGAFLYDIRRIQNPDDFHRVCAEHLSGNDPLSAEPDEAGKLFCGYRELAG
ncbi:MAG: tRNA-dihydrouridine synthase B [Verrucomicrobiales bacterium]